MQKWTQNEEREMINLIKSGNNILSIATKHNRTQDDIINRLCKIIYENINNGNSPKLIATILNLPENKIMEYYNTYKKNKEMAESTNTEFDSIIKRIENNNKILKLVVENKKLHSQLNTMIKNGKLNPNIKDIIAKLKNLC